MDQTVNGKIVLKLFIFVSWMHEDSKSKQGLKFANKIHVTEYQI